MFVGYHKSLLLRISYFFRIASRMPQKSVDRLKRAPSSFCAEYRSIQSSKPAAFLRTTDLRRYRHCPQSTRQNGRNRSHQADLAHLFFFLGASGQCWPAKWRVIAWAAWPIRREWRITWLDGSGRTCQFVRTRSPRRRFDPISPSPGADLRDTRSRRRSRRWSPGPSSVVDRVSAGSQMSTAR